MACEVTSSDGENCKRIKLSSEADDASTTAAEDLSSYSRINTLEEFRLNQILSDNGRSKSVFIAGTLGETEDCAVVLVEKQPIVKESVDKMLNNADLALNLVPNTKPKANAMHYAFYPKVERGGKFFSGMLFSTHCKSKFIIKRLNINNFVSREVNSSVFF